MKKYTHISQVWQDLQLGKTIYWHHEGYKVYIEPAILGNKFQETHFTNLNGKVLSVRFSENYFGSIMNLSDLNNLFSKG